VRQPGGLRWRIDFGVLVDVEVGQDPEAGAALERLLAR
jgi:hypothetical protein